MRNEKQLKALLKKFKRGQATTDELKLLQAWYHSLAADEGTALTDERKSAMLEKIRQSTGHTKIIQLVPWRYVAAAASFALLVTFSWLLFRQANLQSDKPVRFVEISTGVGEVKKIVLPDSSEVWLNAMTLLAYKENFAEDRQIRLRGEAHFRVTHDKAHPFRVQTSDSVETTVLGTVFNISSYAITKQTQVTVVSGRVKVGRQQQSAYGAITANQAIRFDETSGTFSHLAADASTITAWRNGQWNVNSIASLLTLLSTQHGITVRKADGFRSSLAINANFNKTQSPEEIISTFCLLGDCKYRWIDKTTVEFY